MNITTKLFFNANKLSTALFSKKFALSAVWVYSYNYNNDMENFTITKLVKVGTSLGIIIPSEILSGLKWRRGDYFVFGFRVDDSLILKRLSDEEIQQLKPLPIIEQ